METIKYITYGIGVGILLMLVYYNTTNQQLQGFDDPREQVEILASSTVFTLTWGNTGKLILASSTKRVAAEISTNNCVVGGTVYLSHNDVAPATSTGDLLQASSTKYIGTDTPAIYETLRAMVAHANCGLLVTEYRVR